MTIIGISNIALQSYQIGIGIGIVILSTLLILFHGSVEEQSLAAAVQGNNNNNNNNKKNDITQIKEHDDAALSLTSPNAVPKQQSKSDHTTPTPIDTNETNEPEELTVTTNTTTTLNHILSPHRQLNWFIYICIYIIIIFILLQCYSTSTSTSTSSPSTSISSSSSSSISVINDHSSNIDRISLIDDNEDHEIRRQQQRQQQQILQHPMTLIKLMFQTYFPKEATTLFHWNQKNQNHQPQPTKK
jgi:hypothetical protein